LRSRLLVLTLKIFLSPVACSPLAFYKALAREEGGAYRLVA
jgi:hypothetical protein